MKKVLIIGYGDIGRRISLKLPGQDFIGVSRSIPADLSNVEFIQLDWINASNFIIPAENISAVVLILKPSSPDKAGYQVGFLDASNRIMSFLNNNISYKQLIIISSTRVYGLDNGRNITEAIKPLPDDDQGRIILDYEKLVTSESKVDPLILRPSGLYDDQNHWMRSHVNSFQGKKYPLHFAEANMFSRDNLSSVIAKYIHEQEFAHLSGPLICSDSACLYHEIFSFICPEHSFEDFFIISEKQGKTFDPQKLIDSGLMR